MNKASASAGRSPTKAADLGELRATHHADNAYWADPACMGAVLDDANREDRPFLQLLAAATGNGLRGLLSEAIELAAAEARIPTVECDEETQATVVRLILDRKRARARDLVYATLSPRPRPSVIDADVAF